MLAIVNEIAQWATLGLLGLVAWRLVAHHKADRFGAEAMINTLQRIAPDEWGEELDKVTPDLMRHAKQHGIDS
jgi:hypothetical protein